MQYKIMYQPSHSLLEVQLDPSESVVAESDAMVSMAPNVKMDTGAYSDVRSDHGGRHRSP